MNVACRAKTPLSGLPFGQFCRYKKCTIFLLIYNTCTTGDVTSDWITGVMSASVGIISDTVDRTVSRVVVGVTVQLVLYRQTADTDNHYSQ